MPNEHTRDEIWRTILELIAGTDRTTVEEPLLSAQTELWNIDGYVRRSDIEARVDASEAAIEEVLTVLENHGFVDVSTEQLPTITDEGVRKESCTLYRPAGPFADNSTATEATNQPATETTNKPATAGSELGVTELFSTQS
ncbi:hypothetical protein [Halonotius roseus]|uniref:Uncharacterized protein n=1 Tax=Halonotius roseus TaxID=2511997 RepID=A0A544QMS6_9EURY|nr:hypothetical protein [Halonotius roseus]TQQ80190.1 hypothetical protein EWF95_06750 [Halonotius roseus]